MTDFGFNLFDEDFDRYVIGFTENHFIPADTNSPTPSDHTVGYNTVALDYAERSNRCERRNLLDHSCNLDKQRKLSVNKIHTDILHLVFELSERRKVATPFLSKSAMEVRRLDSRLSDVSDTSIKTASSLPLIEVQHLPPMIQTAHSHTSINNDYFGLPDVVGILKESGRHSKTSKKDKKSGRRKKDKSAANRQNEDEPKTLENAEMQTSKQINDEKSPLEENINDKNKDKENENKNIDSRNVTFTTESTKKGDIVDINEGGEQPEVLEVINVWSAMNSKIKEAEAIARMKGDSFHAYKGRYYNDVNRVNVRKMSFCQSSYQERADRERMNNIRRRHSSQAKIGPLDFNKLRRQITMGRSTTLYC